MGALLLLTSLSIVGFRSLQRLHLQPGPVTVVVGPNGSGKTNLYSALQLLAASAHAELARAVLRQGGMPSLQWAGRARPGPVRIELGIRWAEMEYELQLGLPANGPGTAFVLDPVVKTERLAVQRIVFLERSGTRAVVRDADGRRVDYPFLLNPAETALGQLREPERYPELSALRAAIAGWRFYHGFRTDGGAPARAALPGVRTHLIASDGSDLAPALQTILESDNAEALQASFAQAFPRETLEVQASAGTFEVCVHRPGLERVLRAHELSDGTLRFLCLLAALHATRPASLLVLNEPETSLHEALLEPLAQAVVTAARGSQVLLATHSSTLAQEIGRRAGVVPTRLALVAGATRTEQDGAGEPD